MLIEVLTFNCRASSGEKWNFDVDVHLYYLLCVFTRVCVTVTSVLNFFAARWRKLDQFLNLLVMVYVAIATFPSTTGFGFHNQHFMTQSWPYSQNPASRLDQSASSSVSCNVQSSQPSQSASYQPTPTQNSSIIHLTSRTQDCHGEASENFRSPMLATCSPEISAALEEILREGMS